MITTIILLSLLGAVIFMVIGMIWHSPKSPAGKAHLNYIGACQQNSEETKKKMEEMKPHLWKYYLSQFIFSFLSSAFIAHVVIYMKNNASCSSPNSSNSTCSMMANCTSCPLTLLFFIWLCFVVPISGGHFLWDGRGDGKTKAKMIFYHTLYDLVCYVIIALAFWFIV
ncbi:MAG: DUF1761 domain-containing protein [Sediminibacterium sp.]|nr:DUF1761 domain-containing protein [Sediminibacterium sp.]